MHSHMTTADKSTIDTQALTKIYEPNPIYTFHCMICYGCASPMESRKMQHVFNHYVFHTNKHNVWEG